MKDEKSPLTELSSARSDEAGSTTLVSLSANAIAADGPPEDFLARLGRYLFGYLASGLRMWPTSQASKTRRVQETQAAFPRNVGDLNRRLARAEAALEAKIRSVALTSHELRTPLNGILGMADLLARTSLSPEQASYVQAVNTSATALLALVDDMLDAGKIEAGRWSLKPRPVAIEALVEEVIELLAPRAQAKNLELAAHVTMQVPESVSVDPDQLVRILMNLTGNAIKFTDQGGVAIDVAVEHGTEAMVTLALRVRDSGVGISPVDQIRIFGEYEQAEAGPSMRSDGTGLGLAISRTIARAMGGDITLESVPGEGSVFCFRVELPVLRASGPVERPLSGRHIMLVSDKTIEPPVLMRRLFDLGASVDLARTPEAALGILANARPVDTILFDHGESLDAIEFKALLPEPHPPIAVMVAPADRHALESIRDSGIKAHLVKPIRTGSLLKVVSAMLSGEILETSLAGSSTAVGYSTSNHVGEAADLKILLADDNDINILLGQSLLRSLGYASDVACNGAVAVARATEAVRLGHAYDVILMDLHMPALDGFAAIRAIRTAEQTTDSRSFIIALTADITEQSSTSAVEAGADIAMTKPIQQRLLTDSLETVRRARLFQGNGIQRRRGPAV